MAGPGLPTGLTSASSGHISHTNLVHAIVNKFDKDATPSAGQVLTWDGTNNVYVPATPSVGVAGLPAGSTLTLIKSGATWPGAPTTRTDIVIQWKGADPGPSVVSSRTLGSAGILDGVDIRLVTA